MQQGFPLNPFAYYCIVFSTSVLYYTKAYITETSYSTTNPRSLWYIHNRKAVWYSQLCLTIVALAAIFFLLKTDWSLIGRIKWQGWLVIFLFPGIAALYYGSSAIMGDYNLRNTGWLKPFVIGFVWAGLVTVYPVLFDNLFHDTAYNITVIGTLLFIKNFMYIAVLCILFDIKDYAADHNQQLKTFVVKLGLRKTIFYIVIPLCILGLGTFLVYANIRHFHIFKILINTIPFILLIIVAYSLYRRKSIFYYLAIIDGLMLVKAICGTIATIYF